MKLGSNHRARNLVRGAAALSVVLLGAGSVQTSVGAASLGAQAFETPRTTTQQATNYRYWNGSRAECSVDGTFAATGSTDGTPTYSTLQTLTQTDSFVVDLLPPTVTADFSGGGSGTPSAPTGGGINANIGISNGTKGDAFVLTLAAYYGSETSPRFAESTSSDPALVEKIGNNGTANFPSIQLDVPCSAPLGSYVLKATVKNLSDLSGADFDDITAVVGTFNVVPSVNLVGTTTVFGFIDTDGDGIADYTNLDAGGFTAVKSKRGVNTNPGAFHLTELMKTTGQCNTDTLMNFAPSSGADTTDDVVLTAPAGFAFVQTGQTYAKVYAGKDPGLFDFEKPALVGVSASGEVTPLLGSTFESVNDATTPTVLRVKLGNIGYWSDDTKDGIYGNTGDVWHAGGAFPADWKVFVRVRARYVGTSAPSQSEPFDWVGQVHVDGYNGAGSAEVKTNTYRLYHAPVPTP